MSLETLISKIKSGVEEYGIMPDPIKASKQVRARVKVKNKEMNCAKVGIAGLAGWFVIAPLTTLAHELGHYITGKMLGYDGEISLGLDRGLYKPDLNPYVENTWEELAINAGGPFVDYILALGCAIGFTKTKNSYLKGLLGTTSVLTATNAIIQSISPTQLGYSDYTTISEQLETLGHSEIGQSLPAIPIAITTACSYIIGKDLYKQYKDYRNLKKIANGVSDKLTDRLDKISTKDQEE